MSRLGSVATDKTVENREAEVSDERDKGPLTIFAFIENDAANPARRRKVIVINSASRPEPPPQLCFANDEYFIAKSES
jgi:hypothetical protein